MRLRITVEGATYDVEVEFLPETAEDESDAEAELVLPESFRHACPPSDALPDDRFCRSPIAGIVLAVTASVGDQVRKDDPLVVIEAMKMQSTIGAPIGGIVEAVQVVPGDKVKTGQVLVEVAAKTLALSRAAG